MFESPESVLGELRYVYVYVYVGVVAVFASATMYARRVPRMRWNYDHDRKTMGQEGEYVRLQGEQQTC